MIIRMWKGMPQTLRAEWYENRVSLYDFEGNLMFEGTHWLLNQCISREWFQ